MLPLEEPCPAIEVMLGTVSIKISNDVDPKLLSQILKAVPLRFHAVFNI